MRVSEVQDIAGFYRCDERQQLLGNPMDPAVNTQGRQAGKQANVRTHITAHAACILRHHHDGHRGLYEYHLISLSFFCLIGMSDRHKYRQRHPAYTSSRLSSPRVTSNSTTSMRSSSKTRSCKIVRATIIVAVAEAPAAGAALLN